MNGISLQNTPKQFNRNQRNFNLAVDEIRLIRAIHDLTGALEKIESQEAQSNRVELIRDEIVRQNKKLAELRTHKSKR